MSRVMLENWSHIFDTNKLEMDLRKNMPSILINPKNQEKLLVLSKKIIIICTQKLVRKCCNVEFSKSIYLSYVNKLCDFHKQREENCHARHMDGTHTDTNEGSQASCPNANSPCALLISPKC